MTSFQPNLSLVQVSFHSIQVYLTVSHQDEVITDSSGVLRLQVFKPSVVLGDSLDA